MLANHQSGSIQPVRNASKLKWCAGLQPTECLGTGRRRTAPPPRPHASRPTLPTAPARPFVRDRHLPTAFYRRPRKSPAVPGSSGRETAEGWRAAVPAAAAAGAAAARMQGGGAGGPPQGPPSAQGGQEPLSGSGASAEEDFLAGHPRYSQVRAPEAAQGATRASTAAATDPHSLLPSPCHQLCSHPVLPPQIRYLNRGAYG